MGATERKLSVMIARIAVLILGLLTAAIAGGCVLSPHGRAEEQAKAEVTGKTFEAPLDKRTLPELPQPADWRSVLSRALLSNGDLEAAYFEWKASLPRIDQAATWPNSNVAVTFSYMFSNENVTAWNRTTVGLGFDPSVTPLLPVKVRAAGQVALDAAREAGERFRATKFQLQKTVLTAYWDLALDEEMARIDADDLALVKLMSDSAAARAQAGAPLQDLLKTLVESQVMGNELAGVNSRLRSMRAMLNGMLARDANAPLELPPALPPSRAAPADDSQLIAMGVAASPELAGLAQQVAGRTDALELARLAYLPDFSPSASITGNVSQLIGTMVMLPTKLPAIRASIEEAEAMARSARAALRQARQDRAANFIATLYSMRNSEREMTLYRTRVLPAAQQLVTSSRGAYSAGTIGFAELIDSERTLLMVRRRVAEAQVEREKRLIELEPLAGVDVETLLPPSSSGGDGPPARLSSVGAVRVSDGQQDR